MSDNSEPHTFRRLLGYVKPHKTRVFVGLVCTVFMGFADSLLAPLAGILVPGFTDLSKQAGAETPQVEIDNSFLQSFSGNTDFSFTLTGHDEIRNALLILAGFFAALMVFKGVFVYAKEYLMSSVVQKVVKKLRDEMYRHLLRMKIHYFEHGKTGEIMSRISNDVQIVEQSLNSLIMILQSAILSLIFVTAMLYTNWKLTLFSVMLFPMNAWVLKKFSQSIKKAGRRIMEKIADINAFTQETITGIKIVKTFNREEYEQQRFVDKTYQNYAHSMRAHRLVAMLKPVNEFLSKVGMNVVLIFCGLLILYRHMSIEEFVTFAVLVEMAYKPLKSIGDTQPVIARAMASGERIFSLLDEESEPAVATDPGVPKRAAGAVEFRDVWFSYNGADDVLQGIDLKVEPGKTVALVGPSGAGKSTIINLLLKFYEPRKGELLIDGIDIKKLNRHYVRDQMSLVPQETILFSGTIRENIRYGRLDATDDEIVAAAKAANADGFIRELPGGYDTEIGERGMQLSGGQRQRISIARAILYDPPILLFDEATSALDSESEALVQEATNRLMKERTAFVIAHRLSTVKNADRIAVIDRGRIVQAGTHEELKSQDGLYKSLHNLQLQ